MYKYKPFYFISSVVLQKLLERQPEREGVQKSERQSLMVLSFSRAAEAIMFSVGWQAVESTQSGGEEHT